MTVDWLLTGGRVETFHPDAGRGTALAIGDGRVLAVGTDADLEQLAGPATRRTDLRGATVWPGFIDTHIHLEKVSHEFQMLRLEQARSVGEVVEIVRERARASSEHVWIRCFADTAAWNERNLAEGRLPTRDELDAAAPRTPVYLYRRPDRAVINTVGAQRMAERLAGLPVESYDPATGYLHGQAVRVVNDAIYTQSMDDDEYRLAILDEACGRLLRMGVTTVVDPGLAGAFEPSWALYQEARRRDQLPLRVRLMNRFDWRKPFQVELDRLLAATAPPMTGDEGLRAWAVKLLLDGEFATAWMRSGEEIGDAHPHYTGEELRTLLRLAAERGWPVCIHAMGGGAIGEIISAVDDVRRAGAPLESGQVSIAHAFLVDVLDLRECARLGIKISVNPPLGYVYSDEIRAAWGPLAGRTMPLATMTALGFRFAAGSDTHPCAPLHGALMAVTRRVWDGSSLGDHEALTPREAFPMYTRHAGDYVGEPDLGHLAPGARADLVVWPEDPLGLDPEEWPRQQPLAVVIGGRPVHLDPSIPGSAFHV
ncbi:amidohydrolase [Blastococcus sp. SYSU DS0619]